MGESGLLRRLPEELEEGYLGMGARARVTWLEPSEAKLPEDKTLKQCDDFISTLGSLLQPFCEQALGKMVDARSPALVSLSLSNEVEVAPMPSDDYLTASFYSTWRRSQVKIMHFMGPGAAKMVLHGRGSESDTGSVAMPYKLESVELSAAANTVLLFRPDVFDLQCLTEEETLILSASLLEHVDPLYLGAPETDPDDLAWLRCVEGPPGPGPGPHAPISIVNLSSRLMAKWDEPEAYRAGLCNSCDAGVEIPFTRWDINEYWSPDPTPFQTGCKHMSYVEGIEMFDNKYFEIPVNEARFMDPMQRQTLEVGAQNLFKMGITKAVSNRNPHHAGVSVGLDKDDYDHIPKPALEGLTGGTPNVQAIIANRFSFTFNLRGPNYVADTACSASLTATHLAKFMLRDRTIDKIEFHIAIGIHQCLSPLGFIGSSQTHMISDIGRCLTFNESASGYMRGDGCSGLTLKPDADDDEIDAMWRASMVGQNGRAATLTAPNGLSQEEVIWKAIREAKMSPTESCVWSCHGTGTSLGDPIEVGAVRKVQKKEERSTTLTVVTNKTHTGHLEGGAAMTSLLAAVFQVKSSLSVPINHFRRLNPHLDTTGFDANFGNELLSYNYSQGNVHISSFGFGGTNAHAIFWGENVYHAPSLKELFQKRLLRMSPPEVRTNGSTDPSVWDWDGPDMVIHPGDRYSIEMNPDDPPDAPQRWFKEEVGDPDQEDTATYCITGPFNEWDVEQMEDGPVIGLRSITVTVPHSGQVQFRLLRNGNEEEVLYPQVDKCSQKLMPILGPAREDMGREKNTWLADAIPGSRLKIDFFACAGRRSINWTPVQGMLM
eukprot:TRINITY_DN2825_c0_g1_i3.p1 TRINITY_DN2825_c0_g1~~TRINITY_DN2825_c0_g1_i3.p1  ORF type:complete len:973 (+),score=174.21 TRINITY_DN2825_c0_g1_i3:431-2920(+)